ncbi:YlmC/YmxH family sporulation protein [Oceanobacillus sp. 143]|uniref:YlmC/YmxH family sporulation protein n=1 Tax=Oceanobacillus zhaokaii TaxID=2052660 RepID=A0A345PG75_9BACI|nr:YlmC/YmxH family sporulation protein [Oceanobacillus zhaokaii]AXI09005.1 YlmC/YmxH family sporulation protein [Oceanobacillus zhaokaii]QGS68607.1 YlmC/YmxH family sporulation protein [Oceanobacillus sp. 143]
MVKLSELQLKEVIIVDDGRRLGHISDLEINTNTGKITAIILIAKDKRNSLFGKVDELVIRWEQIIRIGSDVVLVKDVHEQPLSSEVHFPKKDK